MTSRKDLKHLKRILVKVGTGVVTQPDGSIALGRLGNVVEQIAALLRDSKQVILVSSGAVGVGKRKLRQQALLSTTLRSHVNYKTDPSSELNQRGCAAAGQSGMMALYDIMFGQKDVTCSQVLVTDDDFKNDERRSNLKNTVEGLLKLGIVPILNENDAISTMKRRKESNESEYLFFDNDSLASLVSAELGVELMILLSDVEGLYRLPPSPERKPEVIYTFDPSREFTIGKKSNVGRGGMKAKTEACIDAVNRGVRSVLICSGHLPDTVIKAVNGERVGTLFVSDPEKDQFMSVTAMVNSTRDSSRKLAVYGGFEGRKKILNTIAENLILQKEKILAANRKDVEYAKQSRLDSNLRSRLQLSFSKLQTLAEGIRQMAKGQDPLGKILKRKELAKGLILQQRYAPIGVLLVIFESRPDVLPQVASLSILSGNGVILKGGKEAKHSNRVLFELIRDSVSTATNGNVSPDVVQMVETREEIADLLTLNNEIDLVIPRGSANLVKTIQNTTNIPVLGHSEGLCHIFVDRDADMEKAKEIVIDAKTDYPAACNAVETLLVHQDLYESGDLDKLLDALTEADITLYGGPRAVDKLGLEPAESLKTEYGEKSLSVEIIDNVEEAIDHINKHSSGHTDCIVTENEECANKFLNEVDSACVFHNTSNRFADGYRFGLGAEVGISTGRIHARGPVGVEGLLTTKWQLVSNSRHIVADFSKGKEKFTHQDLPLPTARL